MRALARQAVQRFAGMEPGRPVGGTYYLYRTLRNLDLDGMLEKLMERRARAGRRRADAARGAPRAATSTRPHRAVQEGDRGRDPPPAGGRPRRRGDGQDAAQAAARRRRLHARRRARRWRRCARRSTRSPASWPPAWPASAATAARARSTSATPCATRCRYGGVPAEPKFKLPAPVQARDHGGRRHLRLGGGVRPLHAACSCTRSSGQFSKVRSFVFIDGIDEVTELLRGRRGHHRGGPPGQHRGRRRVGRRPLRLRPRLRGVLASARARTSARRRP